MMRYFIYLAIIFYFPLTFASTYTAQTDEQEIRSILEQRDRQIKDLVGPEGTEYTDDELRKIQSIINDMIDFRSMADYALGETYNEIADELREEFVSLFTTIVRDQSMNRLEIYRADVSYDEITVQGERARVETVVALENVRTPVHYTMRKRGDEWVITDMIIDEVSTADSYNRQFQSIIRQRGFDALLESLRRRAARI